MISRKTKYGLQSLIYLTKKYGKGPVLIAELAKKERIPKKFLESILLDLKNKGILQSKKGKGGGYALSRAPHEITVGEVIRVLDGSMAPVPCVSQTAYRRCEECHDEETCGIRAVMQDVRDATAKLLDSENLASVLRREHALGQKKRKISVYAI